MDGNSHYTGQIPDACKDTGFMLGNVAKYLHRYPVTRNKRDMEKAQDYALAYLFATDAPPKMMFDVICEALARVSGDSDTLEAFAHMLARVMTGSNNDYCTFTKKLQESQSNRESLQ